MAPAIPKHGSEFLPDLADRRHDDVARIEREYRQEAHLRRRFPERAAAEAGLLP